MDRPSELILILLILLNPFPTSTNDDVEFHNINSPLLPLDLGTTYLIESKHTFIHYINITTLDLQLQNIEHFSYKLKNIFKIANSSKERKSRETTFYDKFNQAEYFLSTVRSKFNNIISKRREKRALIKAVGIATKWLFGTMDEDDQINYDKKISELQSNQKTIARELNLQTSLSHKLIDHYNDTITKIYENQELIKNKINEISNKVKNVDNLLFHVSSANAFDRLILNCQSLINFLDNLEDAILFAHLGILHNSVINLSQLLEITDHLRSIYGPNKIVNFNNDYNYYQLAAIQVRIDKSKIIFAIHMPILVSTTFRTFHLIPLPYNNSIILPNKPYLILGTNFHQFEENLCQKLEDQYLCRQHEDPVPDSCITPLMRAEKSNCVTMKVHLAHPIFQEINEKFLLILPAGKPVKAKTQCEKKTLNILETNTLVKIPKGCSICIENSTFSNKEEIAMEDPLILPNPIEYYPTKIKEETVEPLKLHTINLDAIKQMKAQINQIEIPVTRTWTTLSWSIPNAFSFIFIFALGFFVFIKLRRSKIKLQKRSTGKSESDEPPVEVQENNTSVLFSLRDGGVI